MTLESRLIILVLLSRTGSWSILIFQFQVLCLASGSFKYWIRVVMSDHCIEWLCMIISFQITNPCCVATLHFGPSTLHFTTRSHDHQSPLVAAKFLSWSPAMNTWLFKSWDTKLQGLIVKMQFILDECTIELTNDLIGSSQPRAEPYLHKPKPSHILKSVFISRLTQENTLDLI